MNLRFFPLFLLILPLHALASAPGTPPLGSPANSPLNVPRLDPSVTMRVHMDAVRVNPAVIPGLVPNAANQPNQPNQPVPPPQPVTALTADTMATALKPPGFTYNILRECIVDELSETLLYVKTSKDAKSTVAVPVPKDRAVLAECLAGGKLEDLVHGATIAVRYDPKGVVRPEIVIQTTPELEVLEDAKIADRAGAKLFVVTADKQTRAFQIEGGPAMWAAVVQNGRPDDLTPGTLVKIEYDPSGREGLKITLKNPPDKNAGAAKPDKGCGCRVQQGPLPPSLGAGLFALLMLGLLLKRRA